MRKNTHAEKTVMHTESVHAKTDMPKTIMQKMDMHKNDNVQKMDMHKNGHAENGHAQKRTCTKWTCTKRSCTNCAARRPCLLASHSPPTQCASHSPPIPVLPPQSSHFPPTPTPHSTAHATCWPPKAARCHRFSLLASHSPPTLFTRFAQPADPSALRTARRPQSAHFPPTPSPPTGFVLLTSRSVRQHVVGIVQKRSNAVNNSCSELFVLELCGAGAPLLRQVNEIREQPRAAATCRERVSS